MRRSSAPAWRQRLDKMGERKISGMDVLGTIIGVSLGCALAAGAVGVLLFALRFLAEAVRAVLL